MRLTKTMRESILRKALSSVPVRNYFEELRPIIQNVYYANMPVQAKDLYDSPDGKQFMKSVTASIKDGNHTIKWYGSIFFGPVSCTVRIDDASFSQLSKGSLSYQFSDAVRKSGLVEKHQEQVALLTSVKRRLKATLESVTTTKRLYDVLEPELHHLIPLDTDKTANLPTAVAPVVMDLKRLGAQLPDVQKAAE